MTASLYDFHQQIPSPEEKVQAFMLKVLRRKRNNSPNPAEGFYSETNNSHAEGSDTTTSPGQVMTQQ